MKGSRLLLEFTSTEWSVDLATDLDMVIEAASSILVPYILSAYLRGGLLHIGWHV